jgi:hypothetical protein
VAVHLNPACWASSDFMSALHSIATRACVRPLAGSRQAIASRESMAPKQANWARHYASWGLSANGGGMTMVAFVLCGVPVNR